MKKNKKSFWDYIAITCYRYAPESFRAYAVLSFSNGNKNIPEYTQIKLDNEETSRCGNAFCCGGRKQAITELKKIIRQKIKQQKQLATIGFFDAEYPKQYYFTQQLRANKNNINDMLWAYKRFKNYVLENNCKFKAYTMAKLDGHYRPEETKIKYNYIDINRPLIVNFKIDKDYILA